MSAIAKRIANKKKQQTNTKFETQPIKSILQL